MLAACVFAGIVCGLEDERGCLDLFEGHLVTLGRVTVLSRMIPSVRSEIGIEAMKAFFTAKSFCSSDIWAITDFGINIPRSLSGAA